MYEYEFVRIEIKSKLFKTYPEYDYHEIIKEYAETGWQFKQIFAPATTGYGSASYFELIFEKKITID